MLCECGIVEKKRTILDGIKRLAGDLIVYRIGGEEDAVHYINRCCFLTIVPSLYTFVDISWLTDADIIVVNTGDDTQVRPVVRVKTTMIDRLRSLGDGQLRMRYDDTSRLVTPDYMRIFGDLSDARRRNFEIERDFKQITYRYAAIEHDNKLLRQQNPCEPCDSEEVSVVNDDVSSTPCDRCKSIGALRKSLKDQKLKVHEHINTLQYELDTERIEIAKLRLENERLKDSNAKLAEVNLSMHMNQ